MTKSMIVVSALFAASICIAAPYTPKDEIKTNEKWKLVTIVLNNGTRSQKIIGKLEYDGREIIGEKDHCLTTPLGKYVWRGEYDKGFASGWITLDTDMDIKEVIPVEIDPSEKGIQLFTRKKMSQQSVGGDGKPAPQP